MREEERAIGREGLRVGEGRNGETEIEGPVWRNTVNIKNSY